MAETNQQLITREEQANTDLVRKTLHAQHPIHGAFANVFAKLGGEEFLLDWAEENPDKFLSMLTRMTPALQAGTGHQGDINITINSAIGSTELDG